MMLSEGRQLSQQAIADVISGCRIICRQTVRIALESTVNKLTDAGISVPTNLDVFLDFPDPFEGIDSAYLREKFYSLHMNYVVSS